MENKEEYFYSDLTNMQKKLLKEVKTDTKGGGKFKFDYVSPTALLKQIGPILEEHNFILTQSIGIKFHGEQATEMLSTTLTHKKTTEYISSNAILSQDWDDIKDWGGHVTYKRRYAILTILGIHQDSDKNDGEDRPIQRASNNGFVTAPQVKLLHVKLKDKPNKKTALIKRYGSLEEMPKKMMNATLEWIEED